LRLTGFKNDLGVG